ncbi:hypothetical protein SAMN04488104_100630 [Algoriphagus faecimaris]|uniref:Uncharacterized protein n=1 Tax=Algoriphagus faecimaris TaxID=686796 RepID=A0A1G6PGI5_9BACT|nr:hypothetical protein [Algoriphagus faecimaris]SDC79340.1 hypothetical protein SAMN04488104_100630 [Algoriphagus faecimaris]
MKRKSSHKNHNKKLSAWQRIIWSLLLINFINLTANFYESPLHDPENKLLEDPIDSLSELIYEFVLEGDQDIIPDNGTEQEEKNSKKLTVFFTNIDLKSSEKISLPQLASPFYLTEEKELFFDPSTPPPDCA